VNPKILDKIAQIERQGCSCDLRCNYLCSIHSLIKELKNLLEDLTPCPYHTPDKLCDECDTNPESRQ